MDRAPNFGLPFFFRLVLPGVFVAAVLYPLTLRFLDLLGVSQEYANVAFAGIAVFAGFLLTSLGEIAYEILEGRRWWPRAYARRSTTIWRERVKCLFGKARDPQDPYYDERWAELRTFPVDADGEPTATAPSRLGNVLAAYEAYPFERYGISGVFYWHRLWLLLDADTRAEVDKEWAPTDGLVFLCAGSGLAACAYAAALALSLVTAAVGQPVLYVDAESRWLTFALGVLGLLVLARVWYQLSIPGHIANGEVFKSLFDVFRERLDRMKPATAEEKRRYDDLAESLKYGTTSDDKTVETEPGAASRDD